MKLQPIHTFDNLLREALTDKQIDQEYRRATAGDVKEFERQYKDDKSKRNFFRQAGKVEDQYADKDKQFDPAAENEKQMKLELIDTLQKADNNYVDSAERVRNYINNEIEFGEDAHERIEHAKELIKHVANNTYKTT